VGIGPNNQIGPQLYDAAGRPYIPEQVPCDLGAQNGNLATPGSWITVKDWRCDSLSTVNFATGAQTYSDGTQIYATNPGGGAFCGAVNGVGLKVLNASGGGNFQYIPIDQWYTRRNFMDRYRVVIYCSSGTPDGAHMYFSITNGGSFTSVAAQSFVADLTSGFPFLSNRIFCENFLIIQSQSTTVPSAGPVWSAWEWDWSCYSGTFRSDNWDWTQGPPAPETMPCRGINVLGNNQTGNIVQAATPPSFPSPRWPTIAFGTDGGVGEWIIPRIVVQVKF